VGTMISRLQKQGLFENTTIVVVADHGYAFDAGPGRKTTRENMGEIGPVPFIVKAPHQRSGSIDDRWHSNMDVAPTVAETLKLPLGYETSGRSAFGPSVAPTTIELPGPGFPWRPARASADEYRAERKAAVASRLGSFGSGHQSMYRFGPHREYVGRRLSRKRWRRTGDRAVIYRAPLLTRVRRSTGVVPTEIAGHVVGGAAGRERSIAVTVNGTIQAVGKTFHLMGYDREFFSVMVPERSLTEGHNVVRVFETSPEKVFRLLASVGGT
jgi:hypothetical protein